ncbi:MAG: HD family phosphohydrolase [Eggerthellaceae bacterium]|nr:HD family phosphohydrolase [Eggerthellaceae bacterium]
MEAGMTRDEAFELLSQHNKEAFHIEHAETLEQTLRYFAREFDPENEEFWGIVGLLHDLDWEEFPQLEVHTLKAELWLREAGGTDELVHAIQSHNFALDCCPDPELFMEKVLYATDELTGLIGAAVLMRPSKSVMDLPLKSLKKKFKDKRFAAGCSRDVIREGAELCGWELDELMERTIAAMQSFAPDRDTFQPAE